ncbi:hypothetical protein RR48_03803 [Papilio machaon]|uniref:Swi5-dependent recombination DNA repair protein 1 homolog n=1 Tax=Papilio machaon TaxID=76193 RepID=A0A0N0PB73_PAPMA|nr:hypothetical protein RR48_03803 [Papilio machaon]
MKNEDIKPKENNSPKTPGGISKSHLTSIRRLGLSRKWKKSGVSPFVSPLASNNLTKPKDSSQEETKTRKRKLRLDDENTELSPVDDEKNEINDIVTTPPVCKQEPNTNDSTPIRKVTRKKTRTIPYKDEECAITVKTSQEEQNVSEIKVSSISCEDEKSSQSIPPKQNSIQPVDIVEKNEEINETENILINNIEDTKLKETCNKPPNKLVKECIVVIQNKILKKNGVKPIMKPEISYDSDNEDIPLSHFNKTTNINSNSVCDFKNKETKNSPKVQPLKKTKSTSSRKSLSTKNHKEIIANKEHIKSSQSSNSFSDDDDDFELNKKTIFFPKRNDKIIKPVKAKSTGSITQKDIDELKARIEMKKQLLFAKAQSKDTEEVRGLIKKWRKGCQDALMELLNLMKKNLPDRSDMNYANILEMLKIPASYVGYDPENDCFSTPDDNSIISSIFSDL